jgi:hypothetical protein
MNVVAGLALLAMLGVLYFLPAIIARSRGHMSASAIFALNLLLGWTALGWIAAIVWSLNSNTRGQFSNVAPTEGLTPVDRHGRFVDAERQRSATVHDGKRQTSASRWILATIIGGFGVDWVVGLLTGERTAGYQPGAASVKVIILVAHPALAASATSASVPEDNPCQSSEARRNAAARAIRAAGYDCFSADSVCPYVFSEGFTVACNHYRYMFEIENHGGRWSVTAR